MERMNLMYIVMRKNVFSLALLFSASLMASCNQIGSYVQTTVSKTVADANNEVNAYDYKDSKEHGAVVERNVQVAPSPNSLSTDVSEWSILKARRPR